MGYCVYITRAEDWLDGATAPIAEAEWLSIVGQDPSLSVNKEDFYEYANITPPVEWSGAKDGNCLWWAEGAIECKNPSADWIKKMVELARQLDAKVQGQDGEVYQ